MHTSITASNTSTPRRFVLLPEDAVPDPGRRPRVRRYKLASIGTGAAADGLDGRTACRGCEPRRLGGGLR